MMIDDKFNDESIKLLAELSTEEEYDVILIGTGIEESILAGALARVGKKILHLDPNAYYGSEDASLSFTQMEEWITNVQQSSSASSINTNSITTGFHNTWKVKDVYCKDENVLHTLQSSSNQFCLDLTPRILLAADSFVQTLVDSGVGRYFECTTVPSTFILSQQQENSTSTLWPVPCSKKDVFKSKLLEMREKRLLMKFLQFVADYGEQVLAGQDVSTQNERNLSTGRSLRRPQNKSSTTLNPECCVSSSFKDLMTSFDLTPRLQDIIVHAVTLSDHDENPRVAIDGLKSVVTYVSSIGRFAASAQLVPMYGTSELQQSFCRLAAVYGATYVLRAPVSHLSLTTVSSICNGISVKQQHLLKSSWVVSNSMHLSPSLCSMEDYETYFRKICITTSSLLEDTTSDTTRGLVIVPPSSAIGNSNCIFITQLDSTSHVCPEDYFIWQLCMKSSTSSSDDDKVLHRAIEAILGNSLDNIMLWSVDFVSRKRNVVSSSLPSNLLVTNVTTETSIHSSYLTLEAATANAKAMFEKICPKEEFLPKSASATQAEAETLEEESDAMVLEAAKAALRKDSKEFSK